MTICLLSNFCINRAAFVMFDCSSIIFDGVLVFAKTLPISSEIFVGVIKPIFFEFSRAFVALSFASAVFVAIAMIAISILDVIYFPFSGVTGAGLGVPTSGGAFSTGVAG